MKYTAIIKIEWDTKNVSLEELNAIEVTALGKIKRLFKKPFNELEVMNEVLKISTELRDFKAKWDIVFSREQN